MVLQQRMISPAGWNRLIQEMPYDISSGHRKRMTGERRRALLRRLLAEVNGWATPVWLEVQAAFHVVQTDQRDTWWAEPRERLQRAVQLRAVFLQQGAALGQQVVGFRIDDQSQEGLMRVALAAAAHLIEGGGESCVHGRRFAAGVLRVFVIHSFNQFGRVVWHRDLTAITQYEIGPQKDIGLVDIGIHSKTRHLATLIG